jgi:hypothetical protein
MATKHPPKPHKPSDRPSSPRFKKRSKSPRNHAPSFQITKTRPTTEESQAAWKEIRTASPRAAAILAVTYVESVLRFAITARCIYLSDDELKPLYSASGPLSSFSQATELGFALGVFGPMIRDDLTIIRVIRNAFAHTMKPLSFDTPEFTMEIAKLQYLKTKRGKVTPPSAAGTTAATIRIDDNGETTLGELMERGLVFTTNREKYVEICMMIAADIGVMFDFMIRPTKSNLP